MSRSFFTFLLIIIATAGFAQTKRIAHRYHSGSDKVSHRNAAGSYGVVAPRKVKVHLESGRDTMVNPWDSLARPYYLDKDGQPKYNEVGHKSIMNAKEVGHVAGKLVM